MLQYYAAYLKYTFHHKCCFFLPSFLNVSWKKRFKDFSLFRRLMRESRVPGTIQRELCLRWFYLSAICTIGLGDIYQHERSANTGTQVISSRFLWSFSLISCYPLNYSFHALFSLNWIQFFCLEIQIFIWDLPRKLEMRSWRRTNILWGKHWTIWRGK